MWFSKKQSIFKPKYPINTTVFGYHNCKEKDVFEITKFEIQSIDASIRLRDSGNSRITVLYGEKIPMHGWWVRDVDELYIHHDIDELLKVLIANNKHLSVGH